MAKLKPSPRMPSRSRIISTALRDITDDELIRVMQKRNIMPSPKAVMEKAIKGLEKRNALSSKQDIVDYTLYELKKHGIKNPTPNQIASAMMQRFSRTYFFTALPDIEGIKDLINIQYIGDEALKEELESRGLDPDITQDARDLLRYGIEDKDWRKVKEAYDMLEERP